jgi:hypothetical protein
LSGENVSNDSLNISGLDVGFAPHLSKLAKVIDHHGVIIARHNRRRSVTHCTQPPQQTTQPVSSQTRDITFWLLWGCTFECEVWGSWLRSRRLRSAKSITDLRSGTEKRRNSREAKDQLSRDF